jgi:CheY-like chemotaxis protein
VNARDAMPAGGRLTLSAENFIVDDQRVETNRECRAGPHVLICVTDTGTGIPPEIREKIFEPFFSTKAPGCGTGLGLATAMTIVRKHGGFLKLDSEIGRGTTFKVLLPADVNAQPPQTAAVEYQLPRGHGELVLVIDDEASVRAVSQQTLEAFGYRVILAANGVEALTVFAERRREIAVVLVDMVMPIMDGPTTILAMKCMEPHLRIIAASGLDLNGKAAQAIGAGVKYFLPKPYAAEALLKMLRSILS